MFDSSQLEFRTGKCSSEAIVKQNRRNFVQLIVRSVESHTQYGKASRTILSYISIRHMIDLALQPDTYIVNTRGQQTIMLLPIADGTVDGSISATPRKWEMVSQATSRAPKGLNPTI